MFPTCASDWISLESSGPLFKLIFHCCEITQMNREGSRKGMNRSQILTYLLTKWYSQKKNNLDETRCLMPSDLRDLFGAWLKLFCEWPPG